MQVWTLETVSRFSVQKSTDIGEYLFKLLENFVELQFFWTTAYYELIAIFSYVCKCTGDRTKEHAGSKTLSLQNVAVSSQLVQLSHAQPLALLNLVSALLG